MRHWRLFWNKVVCIRATKVFIQLFRLLRKAHYDKLLAIKMLSRRTKGDSISEPRLNASEKLCFALSCGLVNAREDFIVTGPLRKGTLVTLMSHLL